MNKTINENVGTKTVETLSHILHNLYKVAHVCYFWTCQWCRSFKGCFLQTACFGSSLRFGSGLLEGFLLLSSVLFSVGASISVCAFFKRPWPWTEHYRMFHSLIVFNGPKTTVLLYFSFNSGVFVFAIRHWRTLIFSYHSHCLDLILLLLPHSERLSAVL